MTALVAEMTTDQFNWSIFCLLFGVTIWGSLAGFLHLGMRVNDQLAGIVTAPFGLLAWWWPYHAIAVIAFVLGSIILMKLLRFHAREVKAMKQEWNGELPSQQAGPPMDAIGQAEQLIRSQYHDDQPRQLLDRREEI